MVCDAACHDDAGDLAAAVSSVEPQSGSAPVARGDAVLLRLFHGVDGCRRDPDIGRGRSESSFRRTAAVICDCRNYRAAVAGDCLEVEIPPALSCAPAAAGIRLGRRGGELAIWRADRM